MKTHKEIIEEGKRKLWYLFIEMDINREQGEDIENILISALTKRDEAIRKMVEEEINSYHYPDGADYLAVNALRTLLAKISEE